MTCMDLLPFRALWINGKAFALTFLTLLIALFLIDFLAVQQSLHQSLLQICLSSRNLEIEFWSRWNCSNVMRIGILTRSQLG